MKEDLIRRIDTLPNFELKRLLIDNKGQLVDQEHLRGITEEGKDKAITVVSKRYRLVQFRDLYKKAIAELPDEIDGNVRYYWGKSEMDIYTLNGDTGILIQNSVDKSTAVRVTFTTKFAGLPVELPKVVTAPFRKVHRGRQITVAIQDYFSVLGQVSEQWDSIRKHLCSQPVTKEEIQSIREKIGAGKKLSELLDELLPDPEQETLEEVSYWEVIQRVVSAITKRQYKSDIHKRKKLQRVVGAIIEQVAIDIL